MVTVCHMSEARGGRLYDLLQKATKGKGAMRAAGAGVIFIELARG